MVKIYWKGKLLNHKRDLLNKWDKKKIVISNKVQSIVVSVLKKVSYESVCLHEIGKQM